MFNFQIFQGDLFTQFQKSFILPLFFCTFFFVLPEIDKESCGDPGTPLYGIREGENFSNGGILRFECQFGFELIGERTISCQDNNQWSANIPICICEYENPCAARLQLQLQRADSSLCCHVDNSLTCHHGDSAEVIIMA